MPSPDADDSAPDEDWSPPPGQTGSSPVPPDDSAYWRFYDEVAAAQLSDWLPEGQQRILDVSGACSPFGPMLLRAGHDVLHVAEGDAPLPADEGPGGCWRCAPTSAGSVGWATEASTRSWPSRGCSR